LCNCEERVLLITVTTLLDLDQNIFSRHLFLSKIHNNIQRKINGTCMCASYWNMHVLQLSKQELYAMIF
jgi:hypothetical protein